MTTTHDGDEAAVEAIGDILEAELQFDDYFTTNDFDLTAMKILAAIRAGKVPLPEDAPQIARLKRELDSEQRARQEAVRQRESIIAAREQRIRELEQALAGKHP